MKKLATFVSAVALAGSLGCFVEDRYIGHGPRYGDGDAQVSAAVESKLDSHGMQDVKVSTSDGVVYLGGVVRDAELRDYAGRLASRTRGVRQVVNDIEVARRYRAGDAPEDRHRPPWIQGGH